MATRIHGNKKWLARLFVVGALIGMCSSVWASGFQLIEQNATNLGTAYAGTAALAVDASTGYYNPAGLTRLGREQIAGSLVFIDSRTRIDATGGTPSNFVNGVPTSFTGIGRARSENI